MDIAVWLRGLGLERYEAAFRDNDIDWDALPKLTAEDLKDLGVVLRRGSILRICARSSPRIIAPSRRWFAGSTALSPNTWAMASWSISAIRERMKTTPSMLSGPGWVLSTLSAISISDPSHSKRASGSLPDWWSLAI